MSVQNQVEGMSSLVGGKGHRLVKAKVIQQRRQMDSKRIGGDINMNVEISYDEEAAFHGVAVLKVVREFSEENIQEVGSSCWEVDDTDRRAVSIAGVGRRTHELVQRKSAGKENRWYRSGEDTESHAQRRQCRLRVRNGERRNLVAWRGKVGTLCFIAARVQPGLSYTENVNIVVQNKVIDCRTFFCLSFRAWIELYND